MKLFMLVTSAPLLLFYATISAAPNAQFKSTTFELGNIIEGKTDKIHAEFVVTNTGNETLKIISVRPSCGCTIVKYDSTIAPGKSMKLMSDVDIKGYRSGPFSKSITFTSNSATDPTVKLVISAQIIAPVSVNERYIRLDPAAKTVAHVVDVLSMKKEFAITSISFKVNHSSDKTTWQADLPMNIKYSLEQVDSVRTDGITKFKLLMFTPAVTGVHHGDFSIKTDNPDMKEIIVQGIIQG